MEAAAGPWEARIIARNWSLSLGGRPLTSRTWSPWRSPARAAGSPVSTPWITTPGPAVPTEARKKITIGRTRLVREPAAMIERRRQTGLALKLRGPVSPSSIPASRT